MKNKKEINTMTDIYIYINNYIYIYHNYITGNNYRLNNY